MKKPRSCTASTTLTKDHGQMTIIFWVLMQLVPLIFILDKTMCETIPRLNLLTSSRNSSDDRNVDVFQSLSKLNKSSGTNIISKRSHDSIHLEDIMLKSQNSFFSSDKNVHFVQNSTKINGYHPNKKLLGNEFNSSEWESSFLFDSQDYSRSSFTPEDLFGMKVNPKISRDIDIDPCKSGISF